MNKGTFLGGYYMALINKFHYNSPVILTFSLLSLFALMLGIATNGASTQLLFCVYRSPLQDPLTYIRIFTHVLGHINVEHFFSNFLIILLIGPILEEKYGSKKILVMIVITALITGIINVAFFNVALIGASGIAFMFIILGSFVNLQKGRIPLTFILVVLVFLGKEVIDGLTTNDNISHITHIIGGGCGAVLGFIMNKGKNIPDILETDIDNP